MSQYIDRREAAKSYRPRAGSMSPGLKRAREPYRVKNAILGLSLGAFAVGVWAYSISAVKQDIFDDVDEEAKALASKGTGTGPGVNVLAAAIAADSEETSTNTASAVVYDAEALPHAASSGVVKSSTILEELGQLKEQTGSKPRGLLPRIEDRFRLALDPTHKTFVWGAPPVDDIGKMWKS